MNKVVISIGVVVLILIGSFFLFKQFVGDVRPALLPGNVQTNSSQADARFTGNNNSSVNFKTKNVPFDLKVTGEFIVGVYAEGTGKVRDLTFSPEGILLASVPGEGRIIALDLGSDGIAIKKIVIDKLSGPHGIAFYDGKLFIAEENRLSRFSWDSTQFKATFEKELMKLPSGSHDAHTIVFGKDGSLFVKVGSSCNVCIETDPLRAVVYKTDSEGTNPQLFAKGLRNAAFLALNPESNEVWGTENGRDNLGDDLPQEEVNIIKQGKDYGWPNCYGERVVDSTFYKGTSSLESSAYKGGDASICANTEVAAGFMQAHSAPLGLSFVPQNFSSELDGDLLVAFHGSWNRSEPTGYKVVRLNIENGQVKEQSDFLTGFIEGSTANGRPVDVEFDKSGNLFVSDDKYGAIYVVTPKK